MAYILMTLQEISVKFPNFAQTLELTIVSITQKIHVITKMFKVESSIEIVKCWGRVRGRTCTVFISAL